MAFFETVAEFSNGKSVSGGLLQQAACCLVDLIEITLHFVANRTAISNTAPIVVSRTFAQESAAALERNGH